MKLTTKTRYGARLLIDLAQHQDNGVVTMSEISKRQNISVKYLEQIIRHLKKAKLVKSTRGPKGALLAAVIIVLRMRKGRMGKISESGLPE